MCLFSFGAGQSPALLGSEVKLTGPGASTPLIAFIPGDGDVNNADCWVFRFCSQSPVLGNALPSSFSTQVAKVIRMFQGVFSQRSKPSHLGLLFWQNYSILLPPAKQLDPPEEPLLSVPERSQRGFGNDCRIQVQASGGEESSSTPPRQMASELLWEGRCARHSLVSHGQSRRIVESSEPEHLGSYPNANISWLCDAGQGRQSHCASVSSPSNGHNNRVALKLKWVGTKGSPIEMC